MLRFGLEWMEMVLLRSKSGADEESVLSWNVSPSGSLCQEECLQSREQPSPEAWSQRCPTGPWRTLLSEPHGRNVPPELEFPGAWPGR